MDLLLNIFLFSVCYKTISGMFALLSCFRDLIDYGCAHAAVFSLLLYCCAFGRRRYSIIYSELPPV